MVERSWPLRRGPIRKATATHSLANLPRLLYPAPKPRCRLACRHRRRRHCRPGLLMQRLVVLLAALSASLGTPLIAQTQQPRVLVFSKTAGYRHSSIPNGIAAVRKIGQENGFAVDATEDATAFTVKNLARYRAVVFMSTTGDVLDAAQQDDFERYMQAGAGSVCTPPQTPSTIGPGMAEWQAPGSTDIRTIPTFAQPRIGCWTRITFRRRDFRTRSCTKTSSTTSSPSIPPFIH